MLSLKFHKFIFLFFCLLISANAFAQLTVSANKTATVLAGTIAGPGITVSVPTLTCAGQANGTFNVAPATILGTGTTAFGIGTGILLTTGKSTVAAGPESTLASTNNGTAGDPALATLALTTTLFDACTLEFDFTAVGNSISFNYIFGSEEYNHSTCGPYNDAFAFFISGPGITGTQNMALVPGTTIPVTVNSVNSGVPGPGYTLANCTSMGAGSPFPTYFTDNTGGSNFTYKGFTTVLTASATVTPCSTYHLKMSITDAGNTLYDSGVFIEAGSLTTPTITPQTVCVSGNATFTPPLTGGSWSSSNTGVATINPGTGVATGISTGSATITYTISTGCFLTTSVTVSTLSPITGTLTLCAGGTTTLANPTPGGTWSSSNASVATINITSGVVTGISAGTATIFYMLPSGCSTTAIVNVSPGSDAITGGTSVCTGSTMVLSDGTPGGTWASDNNAVAIISPTGIVTGITAGSATITYALNSGCYAITTVNVPLVAADILTPDTTICNGASVGIRVNGSPTLTYSWSPATGLDNPGIIQPVATPSGPTLYIMTATAPGTSCSISDSITINVTALTVDAGPNQSVCLATPIQLNASPAGANYSYNWSGPDGFTSALQNPLINSGQPADQGTYIVTVTDNITGCSNQSATSVAIVNTATLTNVTPNQTIAYGSSIQLNADNALYYMWTPNDGTLNNNNINDPVAVPLTTTTYTVFGRDLNGCIDSANITVYVTYDTIFIPSAFTPNGDGLNDIFRVGNLGYYRVVEMSVYNRWGTLVYHVTGDENRGWDGTYNGVTQDLGVYNYQIIISHPNGELHSFKGNVTLIR